MALVSCDQLGQALRQWVRGASELDLARLCEALDCGPHREDVLDWFNEFFEGGSGDDVWMKLPDGSHGWAELLLSNRIGDSPSVETSGDGTPDDPLQIGLKISGDPGNRLHVRDDGVGVWDDPPANVARQYVSNSGDDGNDGTKGAPIKTMKEALRRIGLDGALGHYTIYLKAGETFGLSETVNFREENPNLSLRITWFGDPQYGDFGETSCADYYPWQAPDLQRPTLEFLSYARGEYIDHKVLHVENTLRLTGIIVKTPAQNPTYPGAASFIFEGGLLHLEGSDVHVRTNSLFRGSDLRTQRANLTLSSGSILRSVYRMSFTRAEDGSARTRSCDGYPTYNARIGNFRSVLTPSNHGGSYDSTTKTQFGWATSWDIFA